MHSAAIFAAKVDVLALTEVGASFASQRSLERQACQLGWHLVWGAAMHLRPTARASGGDDVVRRGVALLVRRGMPAHVVKPKTPEQQQLFDDGRWGHFEVSIAKGKIVNLHVVYGFSGAAQHAEARSSNEALLELIFSWSCEHQGVPTLVVGDLKSLVLARALESRSVDVQQVHSDSKGECPPPTCYPKSDSVGSRRDFSLQTTLHIRPSVLRQFPRRLMCPRISW